MDYATVVSSLLVITSPEWSAIVERLRGVLAKRGLTQAMLARAMGVKQPAVSRWLKGSRALTVTNFARICSAARLPPDQVVAVLGLTHLTTGIAETTPPYGVTPPTVEVTQDGGTLTLVVHLKPHRTRTHSGPDEEP